ncbi:MAG TPA: DUF1848 family protein [Elusimicrobiales bacterium]|nr:DUF1848 family protein [Elusimicrobiales bacterium]
MHIISASRRTDIPHYYAPWFRARRRAGFADYRTVFGGGSKGYFRASLRPEEVIGYLFWTKFAGPFHGELAALRAENLPYVFQYTITGYGREIEPGIPDREAAIADFLAVEKTLPGPAAIQWRYDPVLISDKTYGHAWHRENFRQIAARLAGHTRVVNVSFTEPYRKAVGKVPAGHNILWRQSPGQCEGLALKHPQLRAVGEPETALLHELAAIAGACGIQLRVCCNKEYAYEFPRAQCCGPELFAPYGPVLELQVTGLPQGPSRESCRCLKTVDIGMSDTCPAGCFYCYVTTTAQQAAKNFENHDPGAARLR